MLQLRYRLPPRRLLRLNPLADPLPPRLRPAAVLGVLDITKYFGDTSGGIRTYLLQKAAYVEARPALRHTLLVPAARASITDGDGIRTYRLAGPRIPTQAPYRLLHSAAAIRRIIRHERPDVIEIGSPFAVPWLTRRATRGLSVPLVWFYHGNVPRLISQHPGHDGALRAIGYRAAWGYVRTVSRLVRATLVASDFVAADLLREGVANVVRVPLGVELDRFNPARAVRAGATRARLGLPAGPIALYCGRLAREKQLDVLIRAWPEVERATGTRLLLVGAGPSEGYFRSLPGADRVVWVPFQHDRDLLADLLAAADLYVAPGPAETFGLSALEALSSGTPVLSVDSGGVPELVARSGAGAVYPVGDESLLAKAAIALLGTDTKLLGTAGRAYAEREHSWPHAFGRIFAAYRAVIEQ